MVIQNASCLDEYDPDALSVTAAKARILAALETPENTQNLSLRQSLGRVLATEIIADHDVPAWRNSAMDGYALRHADLTQHTEFTVVGVALAGHPYQGALASGETVKITTGAMLPNNADTIVMQEFVTQKDHRIILQQTPSAGQFVRYPGEDIRRGTQLFARGHRIRPVDLGLLASQGIAEVKVYARPRVAYFSTGDELRTIGQSLQPGFLYDSNRYTLFGLLQELCVEHFDLGNAADDPKALADCFTQAMQSADVVISTGGVSVGQADFIKDILNRHGVMSFWKIAMRPGRPLTFGQLGRAAFFGLPGNPVSVMVTFDQFVRPALRKLAGESDREILHLQAITDSELRKPKGRRDFQRGVLASKADGNLYVSTTGLQGSHVLSSMSKANCYIVLSEDITTVTKGSTVTVIPFGNLWP